MKSRRFDSEEYLRAFRDRGSFPAIHDAIFGLAMEGRPGRRFLDLCCSGGLLGERLLRQGDAAFALGVDADAGAIEAGRAHGVRMPMVRLRLGLDFLELGELVRRHAITAVVARRCLPEILGDDPAADGALADALADAGVSELYLEGRVAGRRSTHRLRDAESEAEAMAPRFSRAAARGACRLLTARLVPGIFR